MGRQCCVFINARSAGRASNHTIINLVFRTVLVGGFSLSLILLQPAADVTTQAIPSVTTMMRQSNDKAVPPAAATIMLGILGRRYLLRMCSTTAVTTCENHRSQQECRVQLPRHKSSISTQPVHQQLVRRICCTSASLRSKDSVLAVPPSALLLATSPPGRGHMIAQPSSCPNQSCRKSFSVVRVLPFAPDTSAASQVSGAAGRGGWCPGQPSSKLRKSYEQGQVLNIKAARGRVRRCRRTLHSCGRDAAGGCPAAASGCRHWFLAACGVLLLRRCWRWDVGSSAAAAITIRRRSPAARGW